MPLYHFVQEINEICSLTSCTNGGMMSNSMEEFSQNYITGKCPFSKIRSQIQLSTTFILIHERNLIILFCQILKAQTGFSLYFGWQCYTTNSLWPNTNFYTIVNTIFTLSIHLKCQSQLEWPTKACTCRCTVYLNHYNYMYLYKH